MTLPSLGLQSLKAMNEIEDCVVGCYCTLIEDYVGYSDGEIVEDYGMEYVVRLSSGKELTVGRDEVIIYD